jgi:hypothetical protein
MNVLKNFEAVFVVALGVAASASYFASSADATNAASPQALGASVATPSKMAVVTVAAKRMSALEKQRSLEVERSLVKSGVASGSRT